MRRPLFAATLVVAALSQPASAGILGDIKRNLGNLGLPIEREIPIERPANIPTPDPLPMSLDPGVAYNRWLAPQLRSGMALYNRPCMANSHYGARVVRCPVGVTAAQAQEAPWFTLPAFLRSAPPPQPEPYDVETVASVRRAKRPHR